MELPHPIQFDPRAAESAQLVASLPECRGVYLISLPEQAAHLGSGLNLRRRLTRLLVPSYTSTGSGLARYFERAVAVACWPAGSRLEAALLLYQLTRQHFAEDYLRRLKLRLPWFLALNRQDEFARLEIVNRPARKHSAAYGPFFNREAAQRYEQELLGLFQIRRCLETLTPASSHPGCIYGEMNQCLRPCQAAVSVEEYAGEVARLSDFLASNGKAASAALTTARERAVNELDFEQAAQIHKRLEKIAAAAACRDAAIGPFDEFNGVALTKGCVADECLLWPMSAGCWQRPLTLHISTMEPGVHSLDQQLRELLSGSLERVALEPRQRVEHLALFTRWYYSSWRDGAWFPFRQPSELNYRRMVREISNLRRAC